jgi:hypothetical protein
MKEKKITKGIIYEGPSLLGNGADIVIIAIVTANNATKNDKTGGMVQTYIMNKDVPPITAQKTQQDDVNCGDCKHRNKSCYVRVEQSVNSVYRAYRRGSYPKLTEQQTIELFSNQKVRMGTYGEPSAITGRYWHNWLQKSKGNTGYTHQWKLTSSNELKDLCMASTDTIEEYYEAKALGWRVFHVKNQNDEKPIAKAVDCPASEKMGKKLHCEDCMLCNGLQKGATSDVVIDVHGTKNKVNKFKELTMIQA